MGIGWEHSSLPAHWAKCRVLAFPHVLYTDLVLQNEILFCIVLWPQTFANIQKLLEKNHKQTNKQNYTVIHSFASILSELASVYCQCFQAPYGSEVPEIYLVLNEAEIVFYACGLRNLNLKQVQDCSTAVNSWDLETPLGSIILPPLSCRTGSCDWEKCESFCTSLGAFSAWKGVQGARKRLFKETPELTGFGDSYNFTGIVAFSANTTAPGEIWWVWWCQNMSISYTSDPTVKGKMRKKGNIYREEKNNTFPKIHFWGLRSW